MFQLADYAFQPTTPGTFGVNGCSSVSSTDMSICTSCSRTYTLSATSKCYANTCSVPFCSACGTPNFCQVCSSGSPPTLMGQCNYCNLQGCAACLDARTCNVCDYGYLLTGGACVPCDEPNCYACSPKETCLGCIAGYNLLQGKC